MREGRKEKEMEMGEEANNQDNKLVREDLYKCGLMGGKESQKMGTS